MYGGVQGVSSRHFGPPEEGSPFRLNSSQRTQCGVRSCEVVDRPSSITGVQSRPPFHIYDSAGPPSHIYDSAR